MIDKQAEDRILEYLEGELSPEEEKALMEEVAKNPELLALLAEYQQQDRSLDAWFRAQSQFLKETEHPDLSVLPAAVIPVKPVPRARRTALWTMAAAASLIVVGTTVGLLWKPSASTTMEAGQVSYVEGRAQYYTAEGMESLTPDQPIARKARRLKTPADSYLEVALVDDLGRFEMNQNSTVEVSASRDSVALNLERGELLVKVAPQDAARIRLVGVETPQFRAETERGIFSVARGLRGSEITVIEGTVELRDKEGRRQLAKGENYSSTGVRPVAAIQRVAWSRNNLEYMSLLSDEQLRPTEVAMAELPATAAEEAGTGAVTESRPANNSRIDDELQVATAGNATPEPVSRGARTSSYLPSSTLSVFEFADISNLIHEAGGDNLAEVVLSEKIEQFLASSAGNVADRTEDVELIREKLHEVFSNEQLNLLLGSLRGSLALGVTDKGLIGISEIDDPDGRVAMLVNGELEPALEQQFPEEKDRAFFAVENGMLIVGIFEDHFEESRLAARTLTPTPFASSPFMREVRDTVPTSRFTAAFDAKALMDRVSENPRATRYFQRLGWYNMKTCIAATSFADQARNQALRVTFDGDREGVMSWLDQPGPMSSFQFYSPDVHAMLVMRIKRPEEMLGQLLGWISEDRGIDITPGTEPEVVAVQRIAATMGNEFSLGIDNPVLPVPNVKVAVEVIDPVEFHYAMFDFLEMIDDETPATDDVVIAAEDYRGHLVVDVNFSGKLVGMSYAILDDYVVFGLDKTFLKQTIDMFVEGQTISQEAAFWEALPAKSGSYCSALVYASASQSMTEAAPILSEICRNYDIPFDPTVLSSASGRKKANVFYAIADKDRIDFFIEGIRGDYQMSGMIPMVAEWITQGDNE